MKKLMLILSFVACVFAQKLSDKDLEGYITNPITIACVEKNNCALMQGFADENNIPLNIMIAQLGAELVSRERYDEAFKFNKKACDLNQGFACVLVGGAYEEGKGAKQNAKERDKFYNKACSLQNAEGCLRVGSFYVKSKNFKEANKFFAKSCDLNNAKACFNLGFSYAKANGVKANFNKARKYMKKACDLGEKKACEVYKELVENF